MKKLASLVIGAVLLAGLLTGCGDPAEKDPELENPQSMGRYVEEEIPLPEGFSEKYVPFVYKAGDTLKLLGKVVWGDTYDEVLYEMTEEGTWKEITPSWLIENKEGRILHYQELAGGDVLFACFVADEKAIDEALQNGKENDASSFPRETHIKRYSAASGTVEDIPLEVPGDRYVLTVCELLNGDIILQPVYGIEEEKRGEDPNLYYLYKKGETKYSKDISGGMGGKFFQPDENTLIFLRGNPARYESYDLTQNVFTGEVAPEELYQKYARYQFLAADGEFLYFLNELGIHKGKMGETPWETVMENDFTSLRQTDFYPMSFTLGNDGDFYVSEGNGRKVYHYVFRPEIPTVPQTEIRVTSVIENQGLRNTVSQFQVQHPELYVNYTALCSSFLGKSRQEISTMIDDAVKKLNTEILAGKGPDVLLLDDLPLEAYAEKGVLMDLSEMLAEFTGEEYLTGILNAYTSGGKTYAAVKGFFPCYILAKGEEKTYESLENMARAVREQNIRPLDSYWYAEENTDYLLRDLYSCYSGELYGEDGKVTKELLQSWLENAKTVYDSVWDYNGPTWGYPSVSPFIAAARLEKLDTGDGVIIPWGQRELVIELNDPSIHAINTGKFSPCDVIGINANTRCPEESKALVKAFLQSKKGGNTSDSIIDKNVLRQHLLIQIGAFQNFTIDIEGEDNKIILCDTNLYDVRSEEQAELILKDLETFSEPIHNFIYTYDLTFQTILDKSEGFFAGKQSLEQTAEEIYSYLMLASAE